MKRQNCDILIIGAGAIGLSVGIALLERNPRKQIVVVDKEFELARHASGRNSGVLHAGFYYSPQSLKAKFCRDGNKAIRALAGRYQIPIREVGKVVVARNSDENMRLDLLFDRGMSNGVDLELLPESQLAQFEPLAVTEERFIWSPSTAVSNPKLIVKAMHDEFVRLGGTVSLGKKVILRTKNNEVMDASGSFNAQHFVNAAGAQSDRIARSIGIGHEYAMLPFMGVYRSTTESNLPLKRLVYPVPHPVNPFLGVHFTLTIDNKVKIGPTAIPIAGREQYSIWKGWSGSDIHQAILGTVSLIKGHNHDFRAILQSELPKFLESRLVHESTNLVPSAKRITSWKKNPPGIRAQLVHLPTGRLEQDFVLISHLNSTHILNAVSPGWTSAIPFGKYVSDKI